MKLKSGAYTLLLGLRDNDQFFRVPHTLIVVEQALISNISPKFAAAGEPVTVTIRGKYDSE